MNRRSVSAGAVVRREKVIALHCSGAGASQWDRLAEALGPAYEVLVPEHYGCESSGAWSGEHAFTLADEAARTITLIDQSDDKVHLVGHSYGGGVALHVAVARMVARVKAACHPAPMKIYEWYMRSRLSRRYSNAARRSMRTAH